MTSRYDRRRVLRLVTLGVGALTLPAQPAEALSAPRRLRFENLHTGEAASLDYWVNGRYLGDAVQRINHLLRDHRTGDVHPIDPRLLDLLHRLGETLSTTAPFQIISGYRSPRTNMMLASQTNGVVRNSLHCHGLAVDIRVPGQSLGRVRDAARSLQGGGVGFYPGSDFVHVDVGRVRYW
jgi:uncharacterized protein YcbK (DUF882 family)